MHMRETTISKVAKVIFILALVIFLFKENQYYALNVVKDLIIQNIFIVSIFVIIILLLSTKMKGGKR